MQCFPGRRSILTPAALLRWLLLLLAVGLSSAALAHKPSDSYLVLKVEADQPRVNGQWDIALSSELSYDEVKAMAAAVVSGKRKVAAATPAR